MSAIIILEPDVELLEQHKVKLQNLEDDYEILYTSYPEQALEWIEKKEIMVLLMECDMGILSAVELSDMLKISNPDLVQMLMTEVTDIGAVLDVLNKTSIYEILLKPFKFAEDIEKPVLRGVEEYNRRKSVLMGSSKVKGSTKTFIEEYDKLRSENYKQTRDYSNLLAAVTGIVSGNVKFWGEQKGFEEDETIWIERFVRNIVKEYVDTYIFQKYNLTSGMEHIHELFDNEATQSTVKIENRFQGEISENREKDFYFVIYLMAYLCRITLSRFQLNVIIDVQDNYYVVKLACDPNYSSLNGKMLYSEIQTEIRQIMHELVDACMKKIFVKSIKGFHENPYIAVVTAVVDG